MTIILDPQFQEDPPEYRKAKRLFAWSFLFCIPVIGLFTSIICWLLARKLDKALYWDDPEYVRSTVKMARKATFFWTALSLIVTSLYTYHFFKLGTPLESLICIQPVLTLLIVIMGTIIWLLSKFHSEIIVSFSTSISTALFCFIAYMCTGFLEYALGSGPVVSTFLVPCINLGVTMFAIPIVDSNILFGGGAVRAIVTCVFAFLMMYVVWLILSQVYVDAQILPLHFLPPFLSPYHTAIL